MADKSLGKSVKKLLALGISPEEIAVKTRVSKKTVIRLGAGELKIGNNRNYKNLSKELEGMLELGNPWK